MRRLIVGVVVVLVAVSAVPAMPAYAQLEDDSREVTVNYVYAAQIGIGGYEVGGLKVQIFTLPISYTFELDPDDTPGDGERPWKLKVRAPVNLGLYEFSATDTDGTPVSDELQTLAVIPGVELQIPMSQRWTLKPFVDAGVGHGLKSDGRAAYIFATGAKSIYEHPWDDMTLMFGNGLIYAGNAAFGERIEDYSVIETGFGVRRPAGFQLWGVEPEVGLYGIHYYYPEALTFQRFLEPPLKVNNQFEIAMSLGSAGPFELGPFTDPRIGIGYIFGDGLEVVRVNFGFPF